MKLIEGLENPHAALADYANNTLMDWFSVLSIILSCSTENLYCSLFSLENLICLFQNFVHF